MPASVKKASFIVAYALLGATAAANASSYVVTLQEVGSDVVATGSGAIDTSGLTNVPAGTSFAHITPNSAEIVTGPPANNAADIKLYNGIFSGPTTFGSGGFKEAQCDICQSRR